MDPLNLPAAFVVVIAILASARLFRLATVDAAGYPYRWAVAKVVNLFVRPKTEKVAETIDDGAFCAWCSGFWLTLGVAASALAWSDTWGWQLVAIALAANYVQANLNIHLDDEMSD